MFWVDLNSFTQAQRFVLLVNWKKEKLSNTNSATKRPFVGSDQHYICGCSVCTILAEIKAVFSILPLTDNTFNDFSSYPPPITAQNLFPALPLFLKTFSFPWQAALFFLFSLAPSGSLHSGPPSFFLSESHSIFRFSPSLSSGMQQIQPPELMTPIHHLFTSLFQPAKLPKVKQKGRTLFLKYIKFDSKWFRQ